jgi:hypothetical protein
LSSSPFASIFLVGPHKPFERPRNLKNIDVNVACELRLFFMNVVKQILFAQHRLSAFFYFVAGAIAGALVSTQVTISMQSPKLVHVASGGGGPPESETWRITISNQPAFLGRRHEGETAHKVRAFLHLKNRRSQGYAVYWENQPPIDQIDIEPGENKSLLLFRWDRERKGFSIIDHTGEAVANFERGRTEFVLTLSDRIGRKTELPLTVEFDDSHLKNKPTLRFIAHGVFAD